MPRREFLLIFKKGSPPLDFLAGKGYNIYITLTPWVLKGKDDMKRYVNEGRGIHRQVGGAVALRSGFCAMLSILLAITALCTFSACTAGSPSSGGEISGAEGVTTAGQGAGDTDETAAPQDGYILGGRNIAEFSILMPKRADRDEKYAAAIIARAIEERTGVEIKPQPVLGLSAEEEAAAADAVIMIGDAFGVSVGEREMKIGAFGDSPTHITVAGQGGYVVAAARLFISRYIDKLERGAAVATAPAVTENFEASQYPADPAGIVGGTRIALADQLNAACVVVDLANGGNGAPLWSFSGGIDHGFSVPIGNRIDECRLRYSEVLGEYLICCTSSSGMVNVAKYPSGDRVFEVVLSGFGPHSIEYLPSGAVAVACSGNGNEARAMIRFYPADSEGAISRNAKTFALEGAHGVIWDDVREVLWTVGTKEIVAFEIRGEGREAEMCEISDYGAALPKAGGHDISAVYGDPDSLWIGGANIVLFNKSGGRFTAAPGSVSSGGIKCIGSFLDGRIIRTKATNVYAAHNTDRFIVYDANGNIVSTCVFSSRAFYKARIFDPRYT